ncbi:MAG: hypothetical protein QG622_2416 [Actinomycetota bacterium]|nr:hypothetical protein [Actinomycetota bacterium]
MSCPLAETGRVIRQPRAPRRVLPTSPFTRAEYVAPSTDGFVVGSRVTLDSWGMGRVTEVKKEYVVVDFGSAGLRRIPAGTKGFSLL